MERINKVLEAEIDDKKRALQVYKLKREALIVEEREEPKRVPLSQIEPHQNINYNHKLVTPREKPDESSEEEFMETERRSVKSKKSGSTKKHTRKISLSPLKTSGTKILNIMIKHGKKAV